MILISQSSSLLRIKKNNAAPVLLFFSILSLLSGIFVRFFTESNYSFVFSALNKLFPILVFLTSIALVIGKRSSNQKKYGAMIATFLVWFCLSLVYIEFIHYPNFMYSSYGVKLFEIKLLVFALIAYILGEYLLFVNRAKLFKLLRTTAGNPFSILIVILIGVSLLTLSQYGQSIFSPSITYENMLTREYPTIRAMQTLVPEGCPIVHPPLVVKKWGSLAVHPFLQYFVYPKTLISGESMDDAISKNVSDIYCFIYVDDEDLVPWPLINYERQLINFSSEEYGSELDWLHFESLSTITASESALPNVQIITFYE